jgi:hypothetical protein
MTALQSNLLSFQTATQAAQAAMLAELQTLNGRLSTGLRPLTPETPEGPPPIVEPVSEEEGHPEAAPKKRRVKVI